MKTLVTIGLLLTVVGTAAAQTVTPAHPLTADQRAELDARKHELAVRDAWRDLLDGKITMGEAIRRAGGYLSQDVSPNRDAFYLPDLGTLTSKSPLVISGRPQSAVVQISDDKTTAVTVYTVVIESVVRGVHSSALPTVTVEVPGGVLQFDEGTFEAKGGPVLNVGEQFVLFLQPKPNQENAFVVSGLHREGIFYVEIGLDGIHVRSSADRRDLPLVKQFDGQLIDVLLSRVRS